MSTADTQYKTNVHPQDELFFGITVTISRGSVSVSATAIVEEKVDENDKSTPRPTSIRPRIYIVAKADYTVGGSAVTPQRGDVITETVNGESQDFEVLPFGDLPAYEPEDADGVRWRVRTKRRP